ncbi:hypothetical protein BH23CHL4_BH23CHL4_26980 [soil metagenome]
MEGELGRMLRRVLGEAYEEMFPAPPKIEFPRRAVPAPSAEVIEERQIERPRTERPPIERPRIERIETEALVERQARRTRLEDVRSVPEPRPRPATAIAAPRQRRTPGVHELLGSRKSLRQAILVKEILGPPKALQ